MAACADRTIKFYDLNSTNINVPVNIISELDGVPLCLDYYNAGTHEVIIAGDDLGICHVYNMKPKWHACEYRLQHKNNTTYNHECHKMEIEKQIESEIEK